MINGLSGRETPPVEITCSHQFHYSYAALPDLPSRPVGVNLIQGKLADVIQFLDELSSGAGTNQEIKANREEWRQNMERYRYFLSLFQKPVEDTHINTPNVWSELT